MAQPSHESLIQIPSIVLTSLVESLSLVQKELSQLRSDNEALANKLNFMLAQQSRSGFSQFPNLPKEIRQVIWGYALTAPQIHIMSCQGVSRSKVNVVMHSCKEAWDYCLYLRLPYFLMESWRITDRDTVKNYMNPHVDTIWLSRDNILPPGVCFTCSICEIDFELVRRTYEFDLFEEDQNPPCTHNFTLQALAISAENWEDPQESADIVDYVFGTMEASWGPNNFKEFLIVCGAQRVMYDREVSFDEPYKGVLDTLPDVEIKHPVTPDCKTSWDRLARDRWDLMVDFKRKCGVERARDIELSGDSVIEDLSKWEIPRVKYVEAKTGSKSWMIPQRMWKNYIIGQVDD